jgi:hypothetical protein
MTRHGRKIAKVAMARRPTVRLYVDDASGMGLRAVDQVRFARGTARTSPWCAENTEKLIGRPAPLHREVRSSNHDRSDRPSS